MNPGSSVATLFGLLAMTVCLSKALVATQTETETEPDLGSRSLHEVFGLGSEEDPEWPSRQAAPVEELTRRSRGEVLTMAVSRLGNEAFSGTYRDAFLVRVLRAVRPPGLPELLREAYPRLDPGGRYEVLLYGVDERVEALSSFYEDILGAQDEGEVTCEQMLAAKFALEFPLSTFLGPLEQLARRVEQKSTRSLDLTGYGEYGDPARWVSEPETMVRAAIRRVRAAPLHRRMTEEEEGILESLRGNILNPPRQPVHIEDQSLSDALAELQRVYEVAPDPRSLRSLSDEILARRVSIDAEQASAAEAFASFCNQTGFGTTAGYHVGAGAIGDPALARNHAFASGGLIIEAEPDDWDDDEVTIVVSVSSPAAWYWIEGQAFRLVEGRLSRGSFIPPEADFSARLGILSIPVTEREWNRAGRRIEILEGEVEIPIPTSIRRVRLTPQPGTTVREVVDDQDGFEVEVRFGIDIWDFSWAVTTMNFGDVDLIDANGESLERHLYLSGTDLTFHKKGYRRSPRPREIVWTFAPLAEILRVRARWDDVRTLTVEGPRIPHHR
jgi:hypothetical protein